MCHLVNVYKVTSFLISTRVFAPRARVRALPHGGEHLRRLRGRRLSGRRVLLHLPATQGADPAARPSVPAQLPRRDHPHDPHHGAAEPPRSVATVQHGHHQLQLGRREQLRAKVLPRGSGARLPGVLVGPGPHPDPSDSAAAPLHVGRHAAPAALRPRPAAAAPALGAVAECRVPAAPAVLLPPAARRLRSDQGLRRLRTELTGLSRRNGGNAAVSDGGCCWCSGGGWLSRSGGTDESAAAGTLPLCSTHQSSGAVTSCALLESKQNFDCTFCFFIHAVFGTLLEI